MRLSIIGRICALLLVASCVAPSDSGDAPIGPLSLSVISGNNQTAPPGTELPAPLVVRVEDSRGRAMQDQIVNFVVVSGGGSVFAGAALSGRDGIVQERWTLGPAHSGAQRIEARAVDNGTGEKLTFAIFNATLADVEPPVVSNVTVTPSIPIPGAPFDLTAVVSDTFTGGSNIASASYSVDSGPPVAMFADDSAFDQQNELVRAHVPAFANAGQHFLCVTGRDAAGNVSAPSCIQVAVAEDALYVSPTGNDAASGTPASPMRTIQAALDRAPSVNKQRVNVAAGTYSEDVNLRSGVNLYGGYDPATWNRAPATFVTTIAPGPSHRSIGVMADHLPGAVTLDGFTITSEPAQSFSASSYGILAINSLVIISGNHIIAGDASGGLNGSNGIDGRAGPNGFNGAPGGLSILTGGAGGQEAINGCFVNGSNVAAIGGAGGDGGSPGSAAGNGETGSGIGTGGQGGAGGPGDTLSPLSPGENGGDGLEGPAGSNGLGGAELGGIGGNRYVPADGFNGPDGEPGGGGGGAGGGGGVSADSLPGAGNGGGGGAAGGCGGGGGIAGHGGGGSFGIFAVLSTLEITGNTIETGRGIDGGNGGSGAAGGQGGTGGLGATLDAPTVGAGGNGGHGGNGGNGGHAGGGGGGPSIGIASHGGSVTQTGNTFVLGTAGVGGTSPAGGASNGANGVRANVRSL